MIKMKNIISFFVSFIVIVVIVLNLDTIITTIRTAIFSTREPIILEGNEWEKDYGFKFFQESEDFKPTNYSDLVDIFYTALDKGWDEFTFYCDVDYEECLDDVADLSYDEKLLADMNNFIHPYNSYSTIKTVYDDTGEITIKIDRLYSDEEIKKLDKDIDELMNSYLLDAMSTRDKIKTMHDVIIKNTKYDKVKAETNQSEYDSSRINGVLYDHYAICSGYTDLMAVILSKLGVKNFKIASDEHVWNAVYLDNKWYHLDLTWDDPITSSGRDILVDTYFLIDDVKLYELSKDKESDDHSYNSKIYLEFGE